MARLTIDDGSPPEDLYASRPPIVSSEKIAAGESGELARLGYNLSHELRASESRTPEVKA
jgi:hypothetical protein